MVDGEGGDEGVNDPAVCRKWGEQYLTYGKGLDNVIIEALGIQQEEYREHFYELLCQCHNNGMDLPAELDVPYRVVNSWTSRNKRPTFSFLLENYDKLVEIEQTDGKHARGIVSEDP